jgi:hypothetical protein
MTGRIGSAETSVGDVLAAQWAWTARFSIRGLNEWEAVWVPEAVWKVRKEKNLLALPATGLRIVQPSNYTHYPVAAT